MGNGLDGIRSSTQVGIEKVFLSMGDLNDKRSLAGNNDYGN
jgi:hypothetical protein